MRILAIESSCDESAAAYLEVRRGVVTRLEHVVASQAVHEKYGGVVPEVAAREHAATVPRILAALAEKVVGRPDGKRLGDIVDVVAATRGPGLVTSLRIGLDTARTLAAAWKKKFVGVNHIEGHIYSNWLPVIGPTAPLPHCPTPSFPAVVLVVSGGHTELLHMRGHGKYRLLGATRDDAAGETFDKTAKLMGLGYPGGPALSKLAAAGDGARFDFPRPMKNDQHLDLSFSGLKTAVRYFLEAHRDEMRDARFRADVAASVERAITDVLVSKTIRAAGEKGVRTVLLAGGVAANGLLRRELAAAVRDRLPSVAFVEPQLAYCTDNAAMIAMAAYFRADAGRFDDWRKAEADPHWELGR